MLSFAQAHDLANSHIRRRFAQRFGDDVVIADERTIEKAYGWIFFYQRRQYLETGNPRDGLIGLGPLLVDKNTGKIIVFGSFGTTEYWCSLYESGKVREDKDGTVHLLFKEDIKRRRKEGEPQK